MPTIKKINVGGVSYDIGGLTEDVKQASLQIAEKVAYIDENGQDYYDDLYTAFYDNMWNVTNTLSNASTSNPATKTAKDGTYTAIISANIGYTLDGATVSATMGGANVTSAVYSNGTISIPAVTGDVVITVVAVALTVVSISAVYTQSGSVYDTDTLDSLKSDLVVTATFSDSSTSVVPSADYTLSGTLTHGTSVVTVEYGGKTDTISVTVSQNPVLYSLRNQAMTTSSQINTGLYLLSEDKDFTIAYDVTLTAKNSAWKIAYVYETASPWRGLMFGVGGSAYRAKYYTAYEDMGVASQITRTRVVATHAVGSGKMVVYYRNNTASSTSTLTVTNSLEQSTYGPLIIGAHTTNTWAGTIAKLDVLNYAMTQQEAEAYITGA